MTFTKTIKLKYIALMLAAPVTTFAQEEKISSTSYFSNALFDTLIVAILLLLMLIVAMSGVIKNLAQSEYFQEKYKKNNGEQPSNISKIISILAIISLFSNQIMAQTVKPIIALAKDDWRIGGLDGFTFYFLAAIIFVEIIVIFILFNLTKGLIKTDKVPSEVVAADGKTQAIKEKTILDKLNASVDIDKEGEIMLDHNYDGIHELDNDLPPWWKYGFYLTIVVSVIYMINYHVIGTGDLQITEYNKELASAKIQIEEYMKLSASNVDETTVVALEGADLINGQEIYTSNCVACHGKLGEGGVGPNLTDVYWLHEGGISDIFKSIKYGWTDKGMKSWKEDLSPMQIAQVASFIKILAGTNPPNGKAPQGDIYSVGSEVLGDSTAVAGIDTLLIKNTPQDTTVLEK